MTIPNSVTSIGQKAFAETGLTEVALPNPNTVIGDNAFDSSVNISAALYSAPFTYLMEGNSVTITDCDENASGALVIPSSYQGKPVTSIGDNAFSDCSSLTSVTIPDSVTSIGRGAFRFCSSLTSATIPDSVTSIGGWAFANCSSLTSVTIPDGVITIGSYAFHGCTSLTSVTIPDSVTSIGEGAFRGCSSLTSVEVVEGNSEYTSQDGILFDKNKTTLIQYTVGKQSGHYSIPDSVTSIGNNAFLACSSLTSVTIPDSVTSIGKSAFNGCSSLTSVTIPASVTSIVYFAFYKCSSLTSVTIPESVISIGQKAFIGTGLTTVSIPNEDTVIDASAFEASVTIFSGKAPTIESQETVTSTAVGETLVLAVVTSGTNVTHQWSKGGTEITGATSATLELERCYGVGCRQLRTEGE